MADSGSDKELQTEEWQEWERAELRRRQEAVRILDGALSSMWRQEEPKQAASEDNASVSGE